MNVDVGVGERHGAVERGPGGLPLAQPLMRQALHQVHVRIVGNPCHGRFDHLQRFPRIVPDQQGTGQADPAVAVQRIDADPFTKRRQCVVVTALALVGLGLGSIIVLILGPFVRVAKKAGKRKAKKGGRNQVRLYGEPVATPAA